MRQNSIDYPGKRGQAWIPAGQDVRIKNALDRFQPDEGREAYTSQ